jgi:myo-inositol-1(or 4)-monophosphatase
VIQAREAGAIVLDHDGSHHTTDSAVTIAATPGIRDDLLELVRTAINADEHARR